MKIEVKTENLLKCLQSVIGVVERKQTMPILANVLFNITDEKLSITATDLEVELISTTSVSSTMNGSFTLPGRKLLDICRALPITSDLLLQQNDSKISISSKIPIGIMSDISSCKLSCVTPNIFKFKLIFADERSFTVKPSLF